MDIPGKVFEGAPDATALLTASIADLIRLRVGCAGQEAWLAAEDVLALPEISEALRIKKSYGAAKLGHSTD